MLPSSGKQCKHGAEQIGGNCGTLEEGGVPCVPPGQSLSQNIFRATIHANPKMQPFRYVNDKPMTELVTEHSDPSTQH